MERHRSIMPFLLVSISVSIIHSHCQRPARTNMLSRDNICRFSSCFYLNNEISFSVLVGKLRTNSFSYLSARQACLRSSPNVNRRRWKSWRFVSDFFGFLFTWRAFETSPNDEMSLMNEITRVLVLIARKRPPCSLNCTGFSAATRGATEPAPMASKQPRSVDSSFLRFRLRLRTVYARCRRRNEAETFAGHGE